MVGVRHVWQHRLVSEASNEIVTLKTTPPNRTQMVRDERTRRLKKCRTPTIKSYEDLFSKNMRKKIA